MNNARCLWIYEYWCHALWYIIYLLIYVYSLILGWCVFIMRVCGCVCEHVWCDKALGSMRYMSMNMYEESCIFIAMQCSIFHCMYSHNHFECLYQYWKCKCLLFIMCLFLKYCSCVSLWYKILIHFLHFWFISFILLTLSFYHWRKNIVTSLKFFFIMPLFIFR